MPSMPTVASMDEGLDATPGTAAPDRDGGHRPVLLHPLIESLQPRPGHIAVDGTLGGGGVAAAIVRERNRQPITTTAQLRECVERAIPRRYWPKRIHPATRTFQALRIE